MFEYDMRSDTSYYNVNKASHTVKYGWQYKHPSNLNVTLVLPCAQYFTHDNIYSWKSYFCLQFSVICFSNDIMGYSV